MSPSSPQSRSGTLAWMMFGAVWVIAGAGFMLALLGLPWWMSASCLTGTALLATLVLRAALAERGRALRSLEDSASRMLAADLPSTLAGDSAGSPAPDDDTPPELRPLAGALNELANRMRGQLKDVAKKSRNLEALIDALDEPLLVTNNDERVILCSRTAEAMLDVPRRGLLGRPIHEVFTNAEVLRMHEGAMAGNVRRGRVRIVTPLGSRAFQVSCSPVPAAWGEGVFGAVLTLRDVTELDQAVQVKTDFVANASHELRTPVAAIRSAAETLETAADDPQMSARLRTMIISHAERLEEMLRDLLDLSRLESPDVPVAMEPVSIGEIERALRHLSEHACTERKLELTFEMDDELASLRTDRKLLTLILRNLVENATKFAHEGTAIRIVGQVVELEVGPAANSASGAGAPNAVVRFEVIDKGVGIPLAQQERVFERYYQVDSARTGTGSGGSSATGWRRGTGLGLAIVKHAAKALGGRAGLTSVWGQGTTVWVEFPCGL